jgi:hypothetical protein
MISRRVPIGCAFALGLLAPGCTRILGDFSEAGGSADAGSKVDATKPAGDASRDAPSDVSDATYELGNSPCPGLACDGGLCIVKSDLHHCGTCENDCSLLPHIVESGFTCSLGSCIYTCEPGFADCDNLGSGCINEFSSDPLNCGQCGRSCLGGACVASVCQPAPFFDGTSIGASITDFVTDGTIVAWGNATDDTIDYVGKFGGPNVILANAFSGSPYSPVNLAIANGIVAYTSSDGVNSYVGSAILGAQGSGAIETTLSASTTSGLVFNKSGDDLFFLEFVSDDEIDILSCQPTGASCTTITSVPSVGVGSNLAIDSTPHRAIFGDVGNGAVDVYSFSHDTLAPIPSQPAALWVTTDGTYAYWGSTTSGFPAANPILSVLLSAPTTVNVLLPDSAGPCGGIATDDTFLYFIAGSAVYYVPVGGAAAPTLLATVNAHHIKYASKAVFFDDGVKIYEMAAP